MDAVHENNRQFMCGQYGYKHRPKECPAFGQQSSICHRLNHFANVCHNKYNTRRQITDSKSTTKKTLHAVDQEDNTSVIEDELDIFINALQVHGLSDLVVVNCLHRRWKDHFQIGHGSRSKCPPTESTQVTQMQTSH